MVGRVAVAGETIASSSFASDTVVAQLTLGAASAGAVAVGTGTEASPASESAGGAEAVDEQAQRADPTRKVTSALDARTSGSFGMTVS
jgi:hypothetical protein